MARNYVDYKEPLPTVHDHTTYTDGVRLHTRDPRPETDIDVYDD